MLDYWVLLLLLLVFSISCGILSIPVIVDFCTKNNLFDVPTSRKVHHEAVPRLGGVCFLPCMLISFALGIIFLNQITGSKNLEIDSWVIMFLISLAMIYIVGIVDDVIGLGATVKFAVQIVAASLLPLSGLYINDLYGLLGIHAIPFYLGAPLTVFVMVFINNAMNLIDGIDGLAAGLAILSLTGFMLCFLHDGIYTYAIFVVGLLGVLCSYFYFNVWGDAKKGHKIFMGDSGSLTIGFILGFLLIKYSMNNPAVMPYRSDSLMTAYTLLIVPCFDVVRVSCLRLLRRKPLFRADKSHIHHQLMRSGLTQHQTLAAILGLALLFCGLNALLYRHVCAIGIVIADALVFSFFMSVVTFFARRKRHLTIA